MSCYHPKTLVYSIDKDTGEVFPWYSGKEYYKPVTHDVPYRNSDTDFGSKPVTKPYHEFLDDDPRVIYTMPCPCGKCLGCRLDYSRSWADRMTLEYAHTGKAVFITLTYNDEHLRDPDGELISESLDYDHPSLCKRDLQLFMKRLREKFPRSFPAVGYPKAGLRFYAVGEYGPSTFRPHYHLIIFGLDMSDFSDESKNKHIYLVGTNELGQAYYRSDILQDLWSVDGQPIGYVGISEVSYKTFAYVARYTLKKVYDEKNPDERGQLPEWSLMSRMPGLGAFWLSEHYAETVDSEGHLKKFVNPFAEGKKGRLKSFPKYVVSQLDKFDPDLYYKICEDRQKAASDAWLLELQNTDKEPFDYLQTKEFDAKVRTKILKKRQSL